MSMIIGLIIGAIVLFLILKSIIKFTIKTIFIILVLIGAFFTIWICIDKPNLHKPFSIETIEYLLKINDDGSMTTTKQTTHTVLKEIKK